jgi:hypothetical protein
VASAALQTYLAGIDPRASGTGLIALDEAILVAHPMSPNTRS